MSTKQAEETFRTSIGGQALIEGIMMRGPKKQAIAVRKPDGEIEVKTEDLKLAASRCPVLWPVLWCVTFLCFIRNTYKIRNTTLRQTLHNFKKSNQKTKLIRIFDNSDS